MRWEELPIGPSWPEASRLFPDRRELRREEVDLLLQAGAETSLFDGRNILVGSGAYVSPRTERLVRYVLGSERLAGRFPTTRLTQPDDATMALLLDALRHTDSENGRRLDALAALAGVT